MNNIVRKAGLSVDEFAKIVGVSRVAAFNWMATPPRSKPHPQLKPRVDKALEFFDGLIERKKLPLSKELSRTERREKVQKLKDLFQQYAR